MKNLIINISMLAIMSLALASCSNYRPRETSGFDNQKYQQYSIKASKSDDNAFVVEYQ